MKNTIRNTLFYGYDPNCSCGGLDDQIIQAVEANPDAITDAPVIAGQKAFLQAVECELNKVSDSRPHVVPISSGLDSRAILAALVKHSDVDDNTIKTISFGTPGTWDYEIGKKISAHLDVENISIDITSDDFDWSESSLREYAATLNTPIRVLEGYVNYSVLKHIDERAVIWSGFIGEASAGGHQPKHPASTWSEARNQFMKYNQHSDELSKLVNNPGEFIREQPYLPRDVLTFEEQLDFAHRQPCFIKPLVVPDPERYITPYLNSSWLEFALNLPRRHRKNRSLFVDIMCDLYPNLFSMPTDMNYGLSPQSSKLRQIAQLGKIYLQMKYAEISKSDYTYPGINYMDFAEKMRRNTELKRTVHSILVSLDDRDLLNIDALRLWEEHQHGKDREKALRTLCSIELYFGQ